MTMLLCTSDSAVEIKDSVSANSHAAAFNASFSDHSVERGPMSTECKSPTPKAIKYAGMAVVCLKDMTFLPAGEDDLERLFALMTAVKGAGTVTTAS